MRVLRGRRAQAAVRALEQRAATGLAGVEKPVRRIVTDVRKNGDRALRRYAEKWDGLQKKQALRVNDSELQTAWGSASEEFRQALTIAAANIRQYCEWQKPQPWRNALGTGNQLGQGDAALE